MELQSAARRWSRWPRIDFRFESPSSSSPVSELSAAAREWLLALERADELLALCPGQLGRRPQIEATVTQASPFGPWAAFLTHEALGAAIGAASALAWAGRFLQGEGQRLSKPAFGLAAERARARLTRRRARLAAGPHAMTAERLSDGEPPALSAAVSEFLAEPGVFIPAENPVPGLFEEALALAHARDGGGELSLSQIRVIIALHEAGHVTAALSSATFADLFGLPLANEPAREALGALIWPRGSEESRPLGAPPPRSFAFEPPRPLHFEQAARSVFMEGHADCFALIVFAQAQAGPLAELALRWAGARAEFIDADSDLFDSWRGAPLSHDSREALFELAALASARGERPLPLAGGAHELATRCALAGLARWIQHIAERGLPGVAADGLLAKIELLGKAEALAPTPALLDALRSEFGRPLGPALGSRIAPAPPGEAPELGPIVLELIARRLSALWGKTSSSAAPRKAAGRTAPRGPDTRKGP